MQITLILIVIVVLIIAGLVVPRLLDTQKNILQTTIKQQVDDYFLAHTEQNIEKRGLLFERLAITVDRIMGHLLEYYGVRDRSVKQQLRLAMQSHIITYDQFQTLKQFHHMRNEIVHEGLRINGDNEQKIYAALLILRALLGT